MTKKEIKKIVALCQQGVTFRSGVEIILRIELNKKCHFLIPDKIISGIAQSISDFDSILPFKGRGNETKLSFANTLIVSQEVPNDIA
jgi:hypothetical protein